MPTTVSDISGALKALDEAPLCTGTTELFEGSNHSWSLLTIAPGDRWPNEGVSAKPASLLVLEGHATMSSPDGRESLASGHFVVLDTQVAHTFKNEENKAFRALLNSDQHSVDGDGK